MTRHYNNWRTIRSLSEGGQSRIFLVTSVDDLREGQYVLKRLKNLKRIERFKDELEAYARLEHPNIVKLIDYKIDGEKPYIVTQYFEKGHLRWEHIEHWNTIERLENFEKICDAVGFAHDRGVIHRDIKPENIFIMDDGKTPVVGDFGICFFTDEGERVTLTDEAVGSRNYIAPELESGRITDPKKNSDVYSLGKLLYWIFNAKMFPRERHRESKWNLTSKERDISDMLMVELAFVNELLDQSICEDPEERFNSGKHFAANVKRTIFRIKRHAHVLDLNEFQICNFCGIGHYRLRGDSSDSHDDDDILDQYGVHRQGGATWMVLSCGYCGHVQYFRTDNLRYNPWKK